jgi:hypothetical protein
MNPRAKEGQPQKSEETLRLPSAGKKAYLVKLDSGLMQGVKQFAANTGHSTSDVVALSIALGLESMTGDAFRPISRITIPAVFEFLATNKGFEKSVKDRYREYLKSLEGKVEVKEEGD